MHCITSGLKRKYVKAAEAMGFVLLKMAIHSTNALERCILRSLTKKGT